MLKFLVLFSAFVFVALSHMSLKFPLPRNKKNGASYAVWMMNEPMVSVRPQVCHGLDRMATVPSQNVFKAGDQIKATLSGSASHNGGHCTFWYTTNVNGAWTKIIDIKDCTTQKGGFNFMLPKDMDTKCADRCILAWTWIPRSSGACEIYMNCADIKVTGVTGTGSNPIQNDLAKFASGAQPCKRIGSNGLSTIMGKNKLTYDTQDGSSSTTTTTTQNPQSSSTTTTTQSGTVAKCVNRRARGKNFPIDTSQGRCLMNNGRFLRFKCDTGECCSAAGYCGPFYDVKTKKYINYGASSKGDVPYASTAAAFADYCGSNSQADYRLEDCTGNSLCSNKNAKGFNYPLDGTGAGRCLTNGGKAYQFKCPDGTCCSGDGFCGPFYNANARKYMRFGNGTRYYATKATAFADYCGMKKQADYRKVKCGTLS